MIIVVLLGLALMLFLLEIFVPGGVLALIGVLLIAVASVYAFAAYGIEAGLAVFLGGILVSLLFFYFEVKLLASTEIGRRLFVHQQQSAGGTGIGDTSQFIGREAVAVTPMMPGGKVQLGTELYAAISIDGFIAKGSTVIVKDADSFTLRVSNR